jgi:hypothetical protein
MKLIGMQHVPHFYRLFSNEELLLEFVNLLL